MENKLHPTSLLVGAGMGVAVALSVYFLSKPWLTQQGKRPRELDSEASTVSGPTLQQASGPGQSYRPMTDTAELKAEQLSRNRQFFGEACQANVERAFVIVVRIKKYRHCLIELISFVTMSGGVRRRGLSRGAHAAAGRRG
jgi:hypothetical protein